VTQQEARKQDSGLGLAASEEYKRWAGEDFKSDYSETAILIIDLINRDTKSATHILFDALPA
jgi:hypothetical protein